MQTCNRIQYSKDEILALKDKLPKAVDGVVHNGVTCDVYQSYLIRYIKDGKPTWQKFTSEEFDLFFQGSYKKDSFLKTALFKTIENFIFYTPLDQIPKYINDMPDVALWRSDIGK